MKIEFNDGEGGNYSLSLDGSISRDKILKIIDMVELIDGNEDKEKVQNLSKDTSFGKLYNLIEKKLHLLNCSSKV